MKLNVQKKYKKYEKIHFFQDGELIASSLNVIYVLLEGVSLKIKLPISPFKRFIGFFRVFRRLLRLDMCNVFLISDQLLIIRKGIVYNYDLTERKLHKTLSLKQCNNILHQSICRTPDGRVFFGEYGNNPNREPVDIYVSKNKGKSWEIAYTFPKGSIRHVHGCYYDRFTNKIWTLTGDLEGENLIQISDLDFNNIEVLGDGSQKFRAVNLFFKEAEVHWIMDSPIEKNYQFVYNRITKKITKLNHFNGPIWYLKRLEDGFFLAASSVEKGKGVLSSQACLYGSKNLINWEIIEKFEKDFLPMPYFKWGVLAFSEGKQKSSGFTIHFEGLKRVDGKSYIYSLDESR